MKYLTEKHQLLSEARQAKHNAHIMGDRAGYNTACDAEERALVMDEVYSCPCGTEWNGKGRLIIGYHTIIEESPNGPLRHRSHDRDSEELITFCPKCAPAVLAHATR